MITSPQNPLIKRLLSLKNKRDRDQEGCFVIEGEKEIIYALQANIRIDTLFYCEELFKDNEKWTDLDCVYESLRLRKFSGNMREVDKKIFAKIAYRENSGGVVAIAKTPKAGVDSFVLNENSFILVLHGIEKPGNLGALLRTADGAGVDSVIVCDGCVDLYNPNVIRSSLGAIFTIPVVTGSSSNLLPWLKASQCRIVASTPVDALDYHSADYQGPIAIVLGSEKDGLPQEWLEAADEKIKIPMLGQMDSLNVSTSGAVLIYEALRQRS